MLGRDAIHGLALIIPAAGCGHDPDYRVGTKPKAGPVSYPPPARPSDLPDAGFYDSGVDANPDAGISVPQVPTPPEVVVDRPLPDGCGYVHSLSVEESGQFHLFYLTCDGVGSRGLFRSTSTGWEAIATFNDGRVPTNHLVVGNHAIVSYDGTYSASREADGLVIVNLATRQITQGINFENLNVAPFAFNTPGGMVLVSGWLVVATGNVESELVNPPSFRPGMLLALPYDEQLGELLSDAAVAVSVAGVYPTSIGGFNAGGTGTMDRIAVLSAGSYISGNNAHLNIVTPNSWVVESVTLGAGTYAQVGNRLAIDQSSRTAFIGMERMPRNPNQKGILSVGLLNKQVYASQPVRQIGIHDFTADTEVFIGSSDVPIAIVSNPGYTSNQGAFLYINPAGWGETKVIESPVDVGSRLGRIVRAGARLYGAVSSGGNPVSGNLVTVDLSAF